MSYPILHYLCSLFLCCVSTIAFADFSDIGRIYHKAPNLEHFEVCQGGGCYHVKLTSLTLKEWSEVEQLFKPYTQNAEQERVRIADAIGLLEQMVGEKVGTSNDRAGTFNGDYSGQQDCNDEAINTTTYLRLLKQTGLIHFHEIADMRTRNFFFTGWPHTTATIKTLDTGEVYAVDSWFFDNGHPAIIVPFQTWKANYKPADSPIGQQKE